jgi:carboxyl-terminal processing protease
MTKSICLLSLVSLCFLTACGGGSPKNINKTVDWQAGKYKDSEDFKNKCETPRVGSSKITGIPFPDTKGTATDEKNFLRSWSHETYLWYKELPDLDPSGLDTPQNYFEKLKTSLLTSSNRPKDNFHFYEPTEDSEAWEAGVSYGYGLHLKVYSSTPPREFLISGVEPNSPAASAGIMRGDKIMELDNINLVSDNTSSGIQSLNDALFPDTLNEAHKFTLQSNLTKNNYTVTLVSKSVDVTSVPVVKVITQGNNQVGYVQFNTFIENAQDEWVNAINQLKQAGVGDVDADDLVVDLRYNGGGLISIASMVSYMIGGSNVSGKTFIQYVANDQYASEAPVKFSTVGSYGVNKNVNLPTLNFKRVYVLSTGDTCSASELVVNSLRGAGVTVYLIGDSTCGKPYGFVPEDNCGTTYYTIQFKGVNAKGFGEYSDGFVPSATDNNLDLVKGCEVDDNLNFALGDESEPLLAAALNLRANNSCTSAVASNRLQKSQAPTVDGKLVRSPRDEIAIFDL